MLRPDLSAHTLRVALLTALGAPNFTACQSSDADQSVPTKQPRDPSDAGGGRGPDGVGGADASAPELCSNETPLFPEQDSGFYQCEQGYQHRAESKECRSLLPRPDVLPAASPVDAGDGDQCLEDSDCPGPHGYCERYNPGDLGAFGTPSNICRQGCVVDDECPTGHICLCEDPVGRCVEASCSIDADCPGDALCVNVPAMSCGANFRLACQRPDDECQTAADCNGQGSRECATLDDGPRTCQAISVCGRPFLVRFEERRARASSRNDYIDAGRSLGVENLTPSEREALANHWTEIGLMEHASVAAFARFTMQLLAHGAPAALVEASNQAIADEMHHAKLCFSLASAYAGTPVGPGPLDVSGALEQTSIEDVLRLVIREGCVGETQAALEAAEARRACEDPEVAKVLDTIVLDEASHAELAWRFVRWFLAQHPALVAVARHEFALARVEQPPKSDDASRTSLARFGVLEATALQGLRKRVLEAVVLPCTLQLFSQCGSRDSVALVARDAIE